MKKLIRKLIFLLLKSINGKLRFQPFFEELLCRTMLGMNIGGGAVTEKSGESNSIEYACKKLAISKNLIVFDVGANIGNWSKMVYSKLGVGGGTLSTLLSRARLRL